MDVEATSSNHFGIDDKAQSDLHDDEFPVLFYVNDVNSVDTVIRNFEYKTSSAFSTLSSTKYFGSSWSIYSEDVNHSIFFVDKLGNYESIPYDGVPFFVMGRKVMGCTYGPDFKAKQSEKEKEQRKQRGAKARKVVKIIRTDCPAQIVIREIHKFPEFKIENDNKNSRDRASHYLKNALGKKEVVGERRFYLCLPRHADHKGHKLTNVPWRTDRLVLKKMNSFMKQGIVDSKQLQKVTYEYVRNELFKGTEVPPETDSRFFPSKKRIVSMCSSWRKREKKNKGPTSKNGGDILPLIDDPTQKEEEADVSSDEEEMYDEDRLPQSHVNKSIGSASVMAQFDAHFEGCNDLMDQIKNLLILSGDRKVASNVKKRLGKIVTDLENLAKIERKRLQVLSTSEGVDSNIEDYLSCGQED